MSQVYWRLEFQFSGREGKQKVMEEKTENLPFEAIKGLILDVFIKRLLLLLSLITLIVHFYQVEEH